MSELGDGFLLHLGLKTDKDSFDKGFKSIDNITNSIQRMVTGLKTAAPVMTAVMAGGFESQELKTAKLIGISTEALDSWKVAASMAGVNAGALTSSMAQLEKKMQGLKTGQFDMSLAKNLAMLNISYSQFADMDSNQRMKAIISSAQAMEDQGKAALLVGNILGSAGQDYYNYLQLSGKSLESELAIGRSLTFTSEDSKRKAMEFNHEFQGLKEAGTSIVNLFGSQLGTALTPTIRQLREWLGDNSQLISSGITGFVGTLGDMFNKLVGVVEKGAPIFKNVIENFGGLDQVLVKVGLGFAGLKITEFVAGLAGSFSGLNLLKTGLVGIAGISLAGTFLDSKNLDNLTPTIKNNLTKIKDSIQPLSDALGDLIKNATGTDSVEAGLTKIANGVINFAGTTVSAGITAFAGFTESWNAFISTLKGDDTGAFNAYKNMNSAFDEAGNIILDSIGGEGTADKVNTKIDNGVQLATAEKNLKSVYGTPLFDQQLKLFNSTYKDVEKAYLDNKGKLKFEKVKKVNDGIVRPNGQVVSVAPDDWVFAMKDPINLTAGIGDNKQSKDTSKVLNGLIDKINNISVSKNVQQDIKPQKETIKESYREREKEVINNLSKENSIINNLYEKREISNNQFSKNKEVIKETSNKEIIKQPVKSENNHSQNIVIKETGVKEAIGEKKASEVKQNILVTVKGQELKQPVIENNISIPKDSDKNNINVSVKDNNIKPFSETKKTVNNTQNYTELKDLLGTVKNNDDQKINISVKGNEQKAPVILNKNTVSTVQDYTELKDILGISKTPDIENIIEAPEIPSIDNKIDMPHFMNKEDTKVINNRSMPDIVNTELLKLLTQVSSSIAKVTAQMKPVNNTNNASYVINQTFNLNNVRDIPQTIKAQARSGLQDGLSELMQRSAQRYMLMPTTL